MKRVEESAEHVNALVAERENNEMLVQIQHSLVNGNPAIIRPGRKLIKQGRVVKIEGSHSKTVYLVTMTDIIMLCKIKKENIKLKNALSCFCILPLSKCKVRQNPLSRNIEIRCDTEIVMLYVERQLDFDEWVKVLKASVSRFLSNRQTLRKESSSRKPAFSNCDIEVYSEIGVSPGVKQRKRKIQECDVTVRVPNLISYTFRDAFVFFRLAFHLILKFLRLSRLVTATCCPDFTFLYKIFINFQWNSLSYVYVPVIVYRSWCVFSKSPHKEHFEKLTPCD